MAEPHTSNVQYVKWKLGIPFLYDWFTNHELTWPTLSCRWGPDIPSDLHHRRKQYVYVSERTDPDSQHAEPNKLLLVPVELCKPRVAAAEEVSAFHEKSKSAYVREPQTTILHPGEVNRIMEIPQHPSVVATHSDAKEVFIWHFDRQPDRGRKRDDWGVLSTPDLTLVGHKDDAAFALSTSSAAPFVASGGKDTDLLLWSLEDHDGGSLLQAGKGGGGSGRSPTLAARARLKGHRKNIEDIAFKPGSSERLASVGDDRALLLWDTRAGGGPVSTVANAHRSSDLHCVDWSPLDDHLICTGGEDGSLKIWDARKPAAAAHTFELHTKPLTRVEWAAYKPGVLASGGEDGVVCVWDLSRRPAAGAAAAAAAAAAGGGEAGGGEGAKPRAGLPPELMFQHAGHNGNISDFQWHPTDPFTMMSVSDNGAGGALQLWRVNDLIWRPEAEVIAELERFRDDILPRGTGGKPEGRERSLSPGGGGVAAEERRTAAAAEPPRATGASAPALTPAGAFVGVPEGVAVGVPEEEAAPMET